MKHLKLFIICILVLMSGRLNAQTFDVGASGAFSFGKVDFGECPQGMDPQEFAHLQKNHKWGRIAAYAGAGIALGGLIYGTLSDSDKYLPLFEARYTPASLAIFAAGLVTNIVGYYIERKSIKKIERARQEQEVILSFAPTPGGVGLVVQF